MYMIKNLCPKYIKKSQNQVKHQTQLKKYTKNLKNNFI